jgi:glutathionylspermidine synthase
VKQAEETETMTWIDRSPNQKAKFKHAGFDILFEPDDGFYWQEGGYFQTLDECCEDIDDWSECQRLHDMETYGVPEDTPSLPPIPEH